MTGYCNQGRHDECPGHGLSIISMTEALFASGPIDLSKGHVACSCSCHDAWREAERDKVMAEVSD